MGMVNKKEQQMRKSLRQSIDREVKASKELHVAISIAKDKGVSESTIVRYLVAMLSRAEAELGPKKFEEFHPFNTKYLSNMKADV